jgi:hypothetical protein
MPLDGALDGKVLISRHGEQRVRERLGLPRKAVRRTVEKAWRDGVACAATTLDGVSSDYIGRLWSGYRFVFATEKGLPELVTVILDRNVHERREGVRARIIAVSLEGQVGRRRSMLRRQLGLV